MKGLIVNMENSKFIIENGNLKSVVSNEKNIDIPANVIRIAPGAFKNCKAEKITFASGSELKSIDDGAFYGCSSLEGIKIPIGVVKIGDHAFYGCKNMRYISIPDSVVAVGKDILGDCNDLLLIIGNESSEAGTVANQYGLAIRSAYTTNMRWLDKCINRNNNLNKKTFDIFGEKIICHNSLPLYIETVNYYSGRKEPLYDKYISAILPMSEASPSQIKDFINNTPAELIKRLEPYGVFVGKKRVESALYDELERIWNVSLSFMKIHISLCDARNSDIESMRDNLKYEAENKITGLNYGVIGGPLDMLAHSIDDTKERKQQREKAYKELNQKLEAFTISITQQAKTAYADSIEKFKPDIRKMINHYVDTLCSLEIILLTKAGFLDEHVADDLDIQQSAHIMSAMQEKSGDQSFALACAIKCNPMNMEVYVYAAKHKYESKDLAELINYLNIQDSINAEAVKQKKQKEQEEIDRYKKTLSNCMTANTGVVYIRQTVSQDDNSKIIMGLKLLLPMISKEIEKACNPSISEINCFAYEKSKIQAYCMDKLNHIIIEGSWDFFVEHSVSPFEAHPTYSRDEVIEWMEKRVEAKVKRTEKIYQDIIQKSDETNSVEEYDAILKSIESISGYKDCEKYVPDIKYKKEQKKNTNGLGLSIGFFLIAVCELVIGFIGELGLIQLIGIGTLLLSILFIIVYSTSIHKERKNRPEKKSKNKNSRL